MVPAKGLGWPDRPASVTYSEPPGLHHGHAEPEGPELAQIPDGADGAPGAGGLGWPLDLLTGASELLAPVLEVNWSGARGRAERYKLTRWARRCRDRAGTVGGFT
jgi:hypothetical protein